MLATAPDETAASGGVFVVRWISTRPSTSKGCAEDECCQRMRTTRFCVYLTLSAFGKCAIILLIISACGPLQCVRNCVGLYLSAILLNPNVRQMRARVRTRPIIKIRNRSFGRNRSSVLDDGARSISLAKFDAVRIELPVHHVKRIPHRSPRLRRHFANGE